MEDLLNTIKIDAATLRSLKRAYNWAKDHEQQEFTFQRQQVLTAYAKYVIDYMEHRLKTIVLTS